MDAFLYRTPAEPESIKATGVDENDLLSLLMKLIYTRRLAVWPAKFSELAIKLPSSMWWWTWFGSRLSRQVVVYTGRAAGQPRGHELWADRAGTDCGRRMRCNGRSTTGLRPVTLAEFTDQVNLQKITNEVVTFERVREQIADLAVEDSLS